MQATRQFWATAAIGLLFSLLAIGGDQPVALIGVAGIGVWLIATSWTAVRSFQHLDERRLRSSTRSIRRRRT